MGISRKREREGYVTNAAGSSNPAALPKATPAKRQKKEKANPGKPQPEKRNAKFKKSVGYTRIHEHGGV
jgi:hypothetical protein